MARNKLKQVKVTDQLNKHYGAKRAEVQTLRWAKEPMTNQKSTKRPRQHHVVPRTYLELFCIPGSDRVAILDLKKREIRLQRPENVLTRRDYYRQPHAVEHGKDEYVLEAFMGEHLEGELKSTIGKVISGGKGLTEDELIRFLQFLELQHLKVPKQLEFAKNAMRSYAQSVGMEIPEVAEGIRNGKWTLEVRDDYRFTYLHEMTKSGMFLTYFARMTWSVWTMPEGIPLVTTDNPVTIFNPGLEWGELPGLAQLGTVVAFPLDPGHCLELTHPEKEEEPTPDYRRVIEVEAFDIKSIRIRAGRTYAEERALALNNILGGHAERFVIANSQTEATRVMNHLFE